MDSLTPVGDPVTRLGEKDSFGAVYEELRAIRREVRGLKVWKWVMSGLVGLVGAGIPTAGVIVGKAIDAKQEDHRAQAQRTAQLETDKIRPEISQLRRDDADIRREHKEDVRELRARIDSAPMRVAREARPR